MSKLVSSLREAVSLAGLKDGMTVSFHHHLRNGDYVLNMVMEEIARLGVKDLTVNASSLFDTHAPLADHIRNGVVTAIQTDYMAAGLGKEISRGLMAKPVQFRTHGGRPSAIADGTTPIDVAFIAAPSAQVRLRQPGLRHPRRHVRQEGHRHHRQSGALPPPGLVHP